MNLRFLHFLHTGSIILIVISVILAILSETGIFQIGKFSPVHLIYLTTVLWFVVWQYRRSEMRK